MRVLSALCCEDIEDYIKYLPGITAMETVKDKKSLLDAADSDKYDLVLISGELPGSEEMDFLIEALSSEKHKNQRIIFLYGRYDCICDNFIRFLINRGIYDFHVGEEITSKDIERLIFKPAGKEKAFEYYKSHYDNLLHFNYKNHIQKQKKGFLKSILPIGIDSVNAVLPDKLVVSLVSNHSTGKSHTAWNLGYCFSQKGKRTSLFNIDRGYSANLFYDIDEIYYDLLDYTLQNNKQKDIFENCYKKKNLSVITGKLGSEKEMKSDDFIEILYCIRTKSDITIIDTRTGLSDLTRLSIKNSTYDLMIFDCDIMHFHMNMKMLRELGDDFMPEKTIAVINNTDVRSSGHKFIYNELISSEIPFRDIAYICNCGFIGYEAMHTGITPYQASGNEYGDFARDVDSLFDKLCSKPVRSSFAARMFRK